MQVIQKNLILFGIFEKHPKIKAPVPTGKPITSHLSLWASYEKENKENFLKTKETLFRVVERWQSQRSMLNAQFHAFNALIVIFREFCVFYSATPYSRESKQKRGGDCMQFCV